MNYNIKFKTFDDFYAFLPVFRSRKHYLASDVSSMVDFVPEINVWNITYEMLFEFMEKAPRELCLKRLLCDI